MSVEIWPPIAPEQLNIAKETALVSSSSFPVSNITIMDSDLSASWEMVLIDTTTGLKKREVDWLLEELHETLKYLKHGLEDCYALLAPVDPGSTLVLSTPRNEVVKGTVTRVGTRIVKGTIHLRLRTLPAQTLTLNPDHPIHLAPLMGLHSLLTDSLNLLSLTLSYCYSSAPTTPSGPPAAAPSEPPISSPQFISAQLRLLSQHLSEASSLLKGPPLTTADPSWTTRSAAPSHFRPPLASPANAPPPLSFHLAIQDGCLVLWLRRLEPAAAPVNLGTKLALAIGTTRRLEHDESERIFGYCCTEADEGAGAGSGLQRTGTGMGSGAAAARLNKPAVTEPGAVSGDRREVEVFVREKVRVESADPSLLSLTAKLTALAHILDRARRNLAIVMGEELED